MLTWLVEIWCRVKEMEHRKRKEKGGKERKRKKYEKEKREKEKKTLKIVRETRKKRTENTLNSALNYVAFKAPRQHLCLPLQLPHGMRLWLVCVVPMNTPEETSTTAKVTYRPGEKDRKVNKSETVRREREKG